MDALTGMARCMNDEYGKMPLANPDTITFNSKSNKIRDVDFVEMPTTDAPATVAYVDGGNDQIFRSPVFTVSINRVYCATFRGHKRVDPSILPRIQFLALMHNIPDNESTKQEFTIFAEDNEGNGRIPNSDEVEVAAKSTDGKDRRLHYLALELSEWRTAKAAARFMEDGDIVVMDGSLSSAYGNMEKHRRLEAFAAARERGVAICGLSKTTRLMMDYGRPLANHVMEHGPKGAWYVPLGNVWDDHTDNQGKTGTFMVKFHPQSKYVYRLDMPSVQLAETGREGVEWVMASLAANSSDWHIPGYPYGMIDAYRFAQVRRDEAVRYGENLKTLLDPRVIAGMDMQPQRGLLDEVMS